MNNNSNNAIDLCDNLWHSVNNSDFDSLLQKAVIEIGIEKIIILSTVKYSDIYCIPLLFRSHMYLQDLNPEQWKLIIGNSIENKNSISIYFKYFSDYVKVDIRPLLILIANEKGISTSIIESIKYTNYPNNITQSHLNKFNLNFSDFDGIRSKLNLLLEQ